MTHYEKTNRLLKQNVLEAHEDQCEKQAI